eukprot:10441243-Karenia_brevis.AAC.1
MQCGAVAHRGTDYASHLVLSMLAYAAATRASIFVLFLDLIKAFDRVVREVVMGMPEESHGQPVDYLCSIGIKRESALWIAQYLHEYGCVFRQWGVNDDAIDLIAKLHQIA